MENLVDTLALGAIVACSFPIAFLMAGVVGHAHTPLPAGGPKRGVCYDGAQIRWWDPALVFCWPQF